MKSIKTLLVAATCCGLGVAAFYQMPSGALDDGAGGDANTVEVQGSGERVGSGSLLGLGAVNLARSAASAQGEPSASDLAASTEEQNEPSPLDAVMAYESVITPIFVEASSVFNPTGRALTPEELALIQDVSRQARRDRSILHNEERAIVRATAYAMEQSGDYYLGDSEEATTAPDIGQPLLRSVFQKHDDLGVAICVHIYEGTSPELDATLEAIVGVREVANLQIYQIINP